MRTLLSATLLAAVLPGCLPGECGTASYVVAAPDPALTQWDADPATPEFDAIERCGMNYGTFGLRAVAKGLTSLVFDANPADGGSDAKSDMNFYLLSSAMVYLRTDHVAPGAVVDVSMLNGAGLHHPNGQGSDLYQTYPFLSGQLTFGEQGHHPDEGDPVFGDVHPEKWEVTWHLEFGDPQSGGVFETWDGTDDVGIIDDSAADIGDIAYPPPDWTPPTGYYR